MTSTRLRPAVFLDRDGVLNQPLIRAGIPYPPHSLSEFHVLPGVVEACADLRAAGYALVVVTNQPDVARGTLARACLDQIHDLLREVVPLDAIYVCTHDDSDGCPCRKPKPGMILEAAKDLSLDLERSACVGDRWRDIEAARRAGVRAIHLAWDYVERSATDPDVTVGSLSEAVSWIRRAGLAGASEEN
ncbi:HAD family hydrolase [Jatrophihabitans cynanchi]|uniref:D,D-heptose 1,7-bisphosphate phosphatase n=1 Tax=Jatrophihabitans cynanchi TaxID=2944128 RepID=A0ABY7JTY1_9ACTN|nr:HAD family hydrolase [Jatrophihabitans sp. SB3-54]WAX56021.1 HAD family hydrolase [Jatrophihabitans sp. SB3-54]